MKPTRLPFSLLVPILLFFLMLGTANMWGVLETSEARYAEISREMFISGDFLHPALLGIDHYDKPPITYWLTTIAYSLFGMNTFAVRIFLALAYLLQVYFIYRIAKELFEDDTLAGYASLIYATLPIVLISVRALTTDAFVTTFILWSILLWIKYKKTEKEKYLMLMGATLGLGFLTKGPVVLLIPLSAVIGLRHRFRSSIHVRQIFIAVLVFLIIALSWFVLLIYENSSFADYIFFHHFIDRIAHAEVFSRSKPWYYYLPLFPLVSLPWFTTFIMGILKKRASGNITPLIKSILIWWIVVPLLIFSMSSSKLVLYILPVFAGFSLVTAYQLKGLDHRYVLLTNLAVIVVIYIALLVYPFTNDSLNKSWIIEVIPLIALIISIFIAFKLSGFHMQILTLNSLVTIALILNTALFFNRNQSLVNSMAGIVDYVKTNNLQQREMLIYNQLLPSVAFGLNTDLTVICAGNKLLRCDTQFQRNETWKERWIDEASPGSLNMLHEKVKQGVVIISKGKLPDYLRNFSVTDWHTWQYGKWTVSYN